MWSADFAERCLETDVFKQLPAGYASVQNSEALFISAEIDLTDSSVQNNSNDVFNYVCLCVHVSIYVHIYALRYK